MRPTGLIGPFDGCELWHAEASDVPPEAVACKLPESNALEAWDRFLHALMAEGRHAIAISLDSSSYHNLRADLMSNASALFGADWEGAMP